jgi:hypothetical protein
LNRSYDQTGQYQMDQYGQHGGYNMPSYNAGYGSQYGSNGGGQIYPSQQSEYDHTASGHYQDYK